MNREEQDRFREFVAARLGPLRRLAYVTCGDWHLAEDIVVSAMAKLYPRWKRLDRPDLYVQTMVFRAAIDETRRPWRRERAAGHALPEFADVDPADATVDRLRIRKALLSVPKRQRAVLVLRFYEGLSVQETAEVLRCSEGNVKSQSSRGLARLRDVLNAEDLGTTETIDIRERTDGSSRLGHPGDVRGAAATTRR